MGPVRIRDEHRAILWQVDALARSLRDQAGDDAGGKPLRDYAFQLQLDRLTLEAEFLKRARHDAPRG